VKINWQTTSEINNKGFDVERKNSNGNMNWKKIGFVEGKGTSIEVNSYTFTDENLPVGSRFSYRLKQIDNDGRFKYSKELEVDITPDNFHLSQNFPNPFNPNTVISYQLPVKAQVTLKVYDIIGNEVTTLVNEEKDAGSYNIDFNASELSSGVYFYTIQAGTFNKVLKMTFIK
jgi:hypothetical protein